MVPPISSPLPIKILLHRKKTPTISNHFLPPSTPQPPVNPEESRILSNGFGGPESTESRNRALRRYGEEAVFGGPNFKVGWLVVLVALPGGKKNPKPPCWQRVLGFLDVAVGQQHMKTSTFLSGSQVQKKKHGTYRCVCSHLFCVEISSSDFVWHDENWSIWWGPQMFSESEGVGIQHQNYSFLCFFGDSFLVDDDDDAIDARSVDPCLQCPWRSISTMVERSTRVSGWKWS